MGCDPGPSYHEIMAMERAQREAEAKGAAKDVASLRSVLVQAKLDERIRFTNSEYVHSTDSYDWHYPASAVVLQPGGLCAILPDPVMHGFQEKALQAIRSAIGGISSGGPTSLAGVTFTQEHKGLMEAARNVARTLGELLELLGGLPDDLPFCVWDPVKGEPVPTTARLNYGGDLIVEVPDIVKEQQADAARTRVRRAIGCTCS